MQNRALAGPLFCFLEFRAITAGNDSTPGIRTVAPFSQGKRSEFASTGAPIRQTEGDNSEISGLQIISLGTALDRFHWGQYLTPLFYRSQEDTWRASGIRPFGARGTFPRGARRVW